MILPYDDDQPKSFISPATQGLIALNVLVLAVVASRPDPDATIVAWALNPRHPTPLTWLTSLFLHVGLGHLLGNMLFLHLAGRPLEYKLGPWRFLALYFGSGLVASIAQAIASPLPSVGASGAISGLFSAYVLLLPWGEVKLFYWLGLVWTGTWEVSAVWLLLYYVADQTILATIYGASSSIGFAAHLGGVGGGLVAAILLLNTLSPEERETLGRKILPRAVPKHPDDAQQLAARRAAARVAVERALVSGDFPEARHRYAEAELHSVRPVLAPAQQETLALVLVEAEERTLAKLALEDLARVHAGTREAMRAALLLRSFAPARRAESQPVY
jgi:membrane associated rhomboid family serine protease